MISLQPCVQGDRGDTRRVHLDGVSNPEAIASARCLLSRGTTVVELDCTVDADGIATIGLGTTENDWLPAGPEPGTWYGQIETTWAGVPILTWPNDGRFEIDVTPQIDA